VSFVKSKDVPDVAGEAKGPLEFKEVSVEDSLKEGGSGSRAEGYNMTSY